MANLVDHPKVAVIREFVERIFERAAHADKMRVYQILDELSAAHYSLDKAAATLNETYSKIAKVFEER